MHPHRELIAPDHDASFACFRADRPQFDLVWHHHDEWELTWIYSGRGTRLCGDMIGPFADHDLVLIPPDMPHGWWAPASPGVMQRAIVIQFADELFDRLVTLGPEGASLDALRRRAAGGLQVTAADAGAARNVLTSMPEAPPPVRLGRLVETLALFHAHARPVCRTDCRITADPRVARATRHVLDHLTEPISTAAVARHVGMRPDSFARLFRRHTGHSLTGYIHELRIGLACEGLRHGDEPIAAVAFGAGFGNLAHFNRLFKRLRGCTPRAWRAGQQPSTSPRR